MRITYKEAQRRISSKHPNVTICEDTYTTWRRGVCKFMWDNGDVFEGIPRDVFRSKLVQYPCTLGERVELLCDKHGLYSVSCHTFRYSDPKCPKCVGSLLAKPPQDFYKEVDKMEGITLLSPYKRSNKKVLVEDKYGKCRVTPNKLLVGRKPSIRSALDKTKYFINQATEIHGSKYDYSLSNYINSNTKITIICPAHGEFKQTPVLHLQGKGCRDCFYKTNSPTCKERYIKLYKNKVCYNYLMLLENKEESFYKIGISVNPKRRAKDFSKNYEVDIVKLLKGTPRDVWEREEELSKILKDYKFIPDIAFKGYTECYRNTKKVEYEFNRI